MQLHSSMNLLYSSVVPKYMQNAQQCNSLEAPPTGTLAANTTTSEICSVGLDGGGGGVMAPLAPCLCISL